MTAHFVLKWANGYFPQIVLISRYELLQFVLHQKHLDELRCEAVAPS